MSRLTPPVPGSTPAKGEGTLALIQLGDRGNAVRVIQTRLSQLGFLNGPIDGDYGGATQLAVANFQRAKGLFMSGTVDPVTLNALGFAVDTTPPPPLSVPSGGNFSIDAVCAIFPDAPRQNVENYFPLVLKALAERGLGDKTMVRMALATIRAETASFAPISEYVSKYNTVPGGPPYGLYDFRSDLGNGARGDGVRYKGRGFIQLTGKHNYTVYSQALGMGDRLVQQPELANDPLIATRILAAFLKDNEGNIRSALAAKDYAKARKAVNGGTHGLAQFQLAFEKGQSLSGLA